MPNICALCLHEQRSHHAPMPRFPDKYCADVVEIDGRLAGCDCTGFRAEDESELVAHTCTCGHRHYREVELTEGDR